MASADQPFGGEAARDVADVVGEAAVLVDDEHRAARALRRGPRALEGAARAVERDRLRADHGPALDGAVGLRGVVRRGGGTLPARPAPTPAPSALALCVMMPSA